MCGLPDRSSALEMVLAKLGYEERLWEGASPPQNLSRCDKFKVVFSPWECFFFLQSISKGSVGMCGNESEISVKLHPKNVSKKKKKKMERL